MPYFSICIPSYESRKLTKRAIDSVIAQTFTDWEIIISDDSKSDDIKHLIQSYSSSIEYHHNSPGLGSPRNWSAAVSKAKGEFILLLHQDDFFLSQQSLERIAASIKMQHSDVLFTQCIWRSEAKLEQCIRGIMPEQFERLRQRSVAELFECNFLSVPSLCFFKRNLPVKYDENLIYLVDVDFYLQCIVLSNAKMGAHFQPEIGVRIDGNDQVTTTLATREVREKEWKYLYQKWSQLSPEIHREGALRLENSLTREGFK